MADKRTGDRSADPLKETSPPRRPIANVDCYSRAIVGWHAATVKDTAMVTTALKMALWRRDHAERSVASGLIHHSDYAEVCIKPRIRGDGLYWPGLLADFSA